MPAGDVAEMGLHSRLRALVASGVLQQRVCVGVNSYKVGFGAFSSLVFLHVGALDTSLGARQARVRE